MAFHRAKKHFSYLSRFPLEFNRIPSKIFRKYFLIGPDCTGITACSSNPCRQNEKCTPIGSSYECEKDMSKYIFRSIEN